MGHTDLQGLGGFTLDSATREEMLCATQITDDAAIHLSNSDAAAFAREKLMLSDLHATAVRAEELLGTRCYDTASWKGYVSAAIAYMLCDRFEGAAKVRAALGLGRTSSGSLAGPSSSSSSVAPSSSSDSSVSSVSVVSSPRGVRFFVSSAGRLQLSHAGGISSSAALTGAVSLALCQLFPETRPIARRLDLLAQVDYGEYLLGKMAGAADKMAQLYAQKHSITVISSLPESLRRTVHFPEQLLTLLVCTSPIPRLTMQCLSRPFLAARGYSSQHANLVLAYADEVMAAFGSVAYVQAVEILRVKLEDAAAVEKVGLTQEEAELLRRALVAHPPLAYTPSVASAAASSSAAAAAPAPTPCTYKLGLLRELCHGGSLEQLAPELAGWSRRHRRYRLLYRALKLLPELYVHAAPNAQRGVLLHLRKAALYGLSEVERGSEYLMCMDEIARIQAEAADAAKSDASSGAPVDSAAAAAKSVAAQLSCRVQRILRLSALCHDGDRAVTDYRRLRPADAVPSVESLLASAVVSPAAQSLPRPLCSTRYFERTPWDKDPRNDCSNVSVDRWIASIEGNSSNGGGGGGGGAGGASSSSSICVPQELSDLPGGFERGLVDVDEFADEIAQRFSRPAEDDAEGAPRLLDASVRISAAGLSGRVCVHARPECAAALEQFLVSHGWEVRRPVPSAPTQTITME